MCGHACCDKACLVSQSLQRYLGGGERTRLFGCTVQATCLSHQYFQHAKVQKKQLSPSKLLQCTGQFPRHEAALGGSCSCPATGQHPGSGEAKDGSSQDLVSEGTERRCPNTDCSDDVTHGAATIGVKSLGSCVAYASLGKLVWFCAEGPVCDTDCVEPLQYVVFQSLPRRREQM
jgi:hypothetical protein